MAEEILHPEILNRHSEELQEVVGHAPRGIVRWGTVVFLFVLLFIGGISFLVKYTDVLSGQFNLSASNAPRTVLSKIDGKLQSLLIKEKDTVEKGQILAYIETNGSHKEVLRLSEELDQLWSDIQEERWEPILDCSPRSFKNLGELQVQYQVFITVYIHLYRNLKNSVYIQKRKMPKSGLQEIGNNKQNLIQPGERFEDQKNSFLQAISILMSKVDEWKQKYLLIAPVSGRVTFPVLLQEKQEIKAGQDLFYIIPQSPEYFGEMLLGQDNIGKLKLGQQVLISLSGFPFQEFGKLNGEVSWISDFPNKDKQFYVAIALDQGLKTNMNYPINYKNGLTGTAEIITTKTRLINKFLYTMRKIINPPNKT